MWKYDFIRIWLYNVGHLWTPLFMSEKSLKREPFQMMATPRQSLPSFKRDLCGSRLVRTTMKVVWSKFVNCKNSDGASMSLCVLWIYVVLERVARIKLKMSSENKMIFVIASHLNRALDKPFATNGWNGENLLLYPFGAIIFHITYLQSKLDYPTFVPPKKVFKKGGHSTETSIRWKEKNCFSALWDNLDEVFLVLRSPPYWSVSGGGSRHYIWHPLNHLL